MRLDQLRKAIEAGRHYADHQRACGDLEGAACTERRVACDVSNYEQLQKEVRSAHPVEVQLRTLDSKLAAATKQRVGFEAKAQLLSQQLVQVRDLMLEAADAAEQKRKLEEELKRERLELTVRRAEAEVEKAGGGDQGEEPAAAAERELGRALQLPGLPVGVAAAIQALQSALHTWSA